MKACILVGVAPGSPRTVAEEAQGIDGVEGAFPVLGASEVVVRARVDGLDGLAHVLKELTEVEGVILSETLLEIPEEAIA